MSSTKSSVSEPTILISGLVFGEQPRWHEDRLWFSDWGTQDVIAVDMDGNSEVILRGPSFPLCVDWLRDGRSGPSNMFKGPRTGQVLTVEAPAPGAGWP